MVTPQHFIGIDVSKQTLTIALAADEQHKSFTIDVIDNHAQAIKNWIIQIVEKGYLLDQLQIVFEYSGNYSLALAYTLSEFNINMACITPNQSAAYAQVHKDITKTDGRDARRLAIYGYKERPTSYEPMKEARAALICLVKAHQAYQKDLRVKQNQLEALLYNPTAPTSQIKRIEADIEHFEAQIAAVEHEMNGGFLPPANTKTTPKVALTDEQKEYKVKFKLLTSIQGIGKNTAMKILLFTNNFENFETVKELVKFMGCAPSTYQSGTSVNKKGKIIGGLKSLRSQLYVCAWTAVRCNPDCKAMFERLRAKGKPKNLAYIAVAAKLIRQMWGVIHSGQPFDPNFNTKNN